MATVRPIPNVRPKVPERPIPNVRPMARLERVSSIGGTEWSKSLAC